MTRYATDNDDEGDADDPWWLPFLWANRVLERNPVLTPQDPSFVTITPRDESCIKRVTKTFLRAVRTRDDKTLLSTLSESFLKDLERADVTAHAATFAVMNPLFTEMPEHLFVYAYDITEFGITVTLCAVFGESDWGQVVFCVYPDHKRDWKISHFPFENGYDNEADDDDDLKTPKASD